VINTPTGSGARTDGYEIRTAAVRHEIACVTTMTGATAAARAIAARIAGEVDVRSLQEIHQRSSADSAAPSSSAAAQESR
jgi:carbamoyl-phosphate synthase large subunit